MSRKMKSLPPGMSSLEFVNRAVYHLGKDLGLDHKDLVTMKRRSHANGSEGISFYTQTLPSLGKALVQALSSGVFRLPTTFKRRRTNEALPAFCNSLLIRVFDRYTGAILETVDIDAVKKLYQLCFFAYKCELPYSPELKQAVVDRFVETEREVGAINDSLAKINDPLLSVAAQLTSALFSDFSLNDFYPKNGPGVTANVPVTKKYTARLTPDLPVYQVAGRFFFFNEEEALDSDDRFPVRKTDDLFRSRNNAKVILVPKDSRGPRLISCEPAENQYIQQGIMGYMVNRLETHPLTAGHVNFTDQTINQRLAVDGSITRKWATLDLKDASDRNSLSLFRRIFGETPLLFEMLEKSRSEATILPGKSEVEKLHLNKFAPMGSACCFPVMAYSIYILLYLGLLGLGLKPEEARNSVYVYGDDIVVPTEYAHYAITILERYGFMVNREKSFINSRFLESCGVDSFDGVICSPIRLRQIWRNKDPNTQIATVACANLLAGRGYRRSAEFLFSCWERLRGPLPYGTDKSPYVCRVTLDVGSVLRLNLTSPGIRMKKRSNRDRFPQGVSLLAWKIFSTKQSDIETGWSRLRRVLPLMGLDCPVPGFGQYDQPRSIRLGLADFGPLEQTAV